ncbi:MAG: LUD domain-containing protein [Alistipes sp.]|nr:LUD domain-containing protein [Candidatus Minthomonas equi]
MSSKENILNRIRNASTEKFEKAEISIDAITYPDPVTQFINACKTVSGAEVSFDTPPSDDIRGESSTVRGAFGVAENGCIWIPQTEADRSYLFASEHLDIIVAKTDILNNMHEAYERIAASEEYFKEYKFGTFISGPSKTADIEGALVYGAQAARSVTVYLT